LIIVLKNLFPKIASTKCLLFQWRHFLDLP
jgi:hypothetical protein